LCNDCRAVQAQSFSDPQAGSLTQHQVGPFAARAEGEGEVMMRILIILAAISFSAAAFAQSAPPKVGNKPMVQVKPKEPAGCKLVGTVKGTKLWAGDCVGSELRGTTSATETQSLPQRAIEVIPPGQKE
jgi:hypothetical protein